MQVFNCYFKIVRKFIPSIIIYLVVFIGLSIRLSTVGQKSEKESFQSYQVKMAVVDRDHSVLSEALKNYIGDQQELVEVKDTKESMADNLIARTVEYILIIPENFQKDCEEGKGKTENIKVPGSYSGYFLDQQVEQYLKILKMAILGGAAPEEAAQSASRTLAIAGSVSFVDQEVQQEVPSVYYYFRYMPYLMLAVLLSGLCPVLMAFGKKEVKKRNDCSSMTLWQRNRQLIAASSVIGAGFWIFILGVALIIYREEFFTSGIPYLVLNSFCMLLVASGISFFAGNLVRKKEVLAMVVNTVGMGLCFLSGVFIPQSVMSEKLLLVSRFLPTFWYVKVVDLLGNTVEPSGQMLSEVWIGIGIQLGFAAAIFSVALTAIKTKRDLG